MACLYLVYSVSIKIHMTTLFITVCFLMFINPFLFHFKIRYKTYIHIYAFILLFGHTLLVFRL
jgi:hypothetical protein